MFPVAVIWYSSDGNAILRPLTSGFVDVIILSYNGANGPDTKTMRMFRPFRQVAAPGSEVCRLRLYLVSMQIFIARNSVDRVFTAVSVFFPDDIPKTETSKDHQ